MDAKTAVHPRCENCIKGLGVDRRVQARVHNIICNMNLPTLYRVDRKLWSTIKKLYTESGGVHGVRTRTHTHKRILNVISERKHSLLRISSDPRTKHIVQFTAYTCQKVLFP